MDSDPTEYTMPDLSFHERHRRLTSGSRAPILGLMPMQSNGLRRRGLPLFAHPSRHNLTPGWALTSTHSASQTKLWRLLRKRPYTSLYTQEYVYTYTRSMLSGLLGGMLGVEGSSMHCSSMLHDLGVLRSSMHGPDSMLHGLVYGPGAALRLCHCCRHFATIIFLAPVLSGSTPPHTPDTSVPSRFGKTALRTGQPTQGSPRGCRAHGGGARRDEGGFVEGASAAMHGALVALTHHCTGLRCNRLS